MSKYITEYDMQTNNFLAVTGTTLDIYKNSNDFIIFYVFYKKTLVIVYVL